MPRAFRLCSRNMEMPRACKVCMTYIFHTYVCSQLEQCISRCMPKKKEVILGLILVNIKIQHPCCPTEVLVASGTCT